MNAKSLPVPARRRGACPTLAAPMETGDGLLARLRPAAGKLTPEQLAALARAARDCGNGIVEVTARGSIQVRGLRPETVGRLQEQLDAADIVIDEGLVVEHSPLAGVDPDAVCNPLPLIADLQQVVSAHVGALAPKLSLVADAGGRSGLATLKADIRLSGVEGGWWLEVGDRPVGRLAEQDVPAAVAELLTRLSALGPTARGRDLDLTAFGFAASEGNAAAPQSGGLPIGVLPLTDGRYALGMALPYGQASAYMLEALAAVIAGPIISAPARALVVPDLDKAALISLQDKAESLGFWTDPNHSGLKIAACAGAIACAAGHIHTKSVAARLLAKAPDFFIDGFEVHVSGCGKGCAHPRVAGLTLVGLPEGCGIVANGLASDKPLALIAKSDIEAGIDDFVAMIRAERTDGESIAACLLRLAPASF
jgi:precorrin-3B synthase